MDMHYSSIEAFLVDEALMLPFLYHHRYHKKTTWYRFCCNNERMLLSIHYIQWQSTTIAMYSCRTFQIRILNRSFVCSLRILFFSCSLPLFDFFFFFTEFTAYKRNDQDCRQGDLEYRASIYRHCSSITGHVCISILPSSVSLFSYMDRRFCFIQTVQHLHFAIYIICGLLYTFPLLHGHCYITWRYGRL